MKSKNDRLSARIAIVASLIVAAAVCFSLPAATFAGQGGAAMLPINVEVNSSVPISSDLQAKIIKATEDLIRKNLSEVLSQSYQTDASANISEKTSKGYMVEVLVVSLYKQSFTAQMSRIQYTYKDGQVNLLKVEPSFQPK